MIPISHFCHVEKKEPGERPSGNKEMGIMSPYFFCPPIFSACMAGGKFGK
jgi:hypothetical protein